MNDWIGNRTTKLLTWPETKSLFEERDRLRLAAWVALLASRRARRRLLGAAGDDVPTDLVAMAEKNPAPRRDRALASYIEEKCGHEFWTHMREVEKECRTRAPETSARIRDAAEAVRRVEQKLVAANVSLCTYTAQRWIGHGLPLEDLIQEGAAGLHTAVRRFDVKLGNRFSTYAMWWIRHGIRRAVENDGVIRVPVHLQTTLAKIRKLRKEGKTDEEVAASLKITMERLEDILSVETRPPHSMDAPLRAEMKDGNRISDYIPGPDIIGTIEDNQDAYWRHGLVVRAMARLHPREALVLERRSHGLTLDTVGKEIGLSRERVRQLEALAVRKVRRMISADHPTLFGIKKKSARPPANPPSQVQAEVVRRRHLPIIRRKESIRRQHKEVSLGRLLYPETVERPKTRGDCKDGPRPCPFVGCKWNLWLDVTKAGTMFHSSEEPWEMRPSCALDVAEDAGPLDGEQIAAILGVSRQRVEQILSGALLKLAENSASLRFFLEDRWPY